MMNFHGSGVIQFGDQSYSGPMHVAIRDTGHNRGKPAAGAIVGDTITEELCNAAYSCDEPTLKVEYLGGSKEFTSNQFHLGEVKPDGFFIKFELKRGHTLKPDPT